MAVLVLLLRASYQTLLKLPLLDHRLIAFQCLLSHWQRQRICETSPAVAYTIRILRLMRFGWNLAPLDDTKW